MGPGVILGTQRALGVPPVEVNAFSTAELDTLPAPVSGFQMAALFVDLAVVPTREVGPGNEWLLARGESSPAVADL